jgi:hypothetical protein
MSPGFGLGKSVGVQKFSTDFLRRACARCHMPCRPLHALLYGFSLLPITWCCRWLNNEQALEDSAKFMRNVRFENINEELTARKAPWIVRVPSPTSYCSCRVLWGSYAGARAAHMRVLYPDLVFGAIASSGAHLLFSIILHKRY